jgi:hypothetical protein
LLKKEEKVLGDNAVSLDDPGAVSLSGQMPSELLK